MQVPTQSAFQVSEGILYLNACRKGRTASAAVWMCHRTSINISGLLSAERSCSYITARQQLLNSKIPLCLLTLSPLSMLWRDWRNKIKKETLDNKFQSGANSNALTSNHPWLPVSAQYRSVFHDVPPPPHLPPSPITFFLTSQILSSPTVAPPSLLCSQVVRWRWRSSEECLALLSSVFVPFDFCAPTTPPQPNHLQNVEPSLLCAGGGIFWSGQSKEGDLLLLVTFLDFFYGSLFIIGFSCGTKGGGTKSRDGGLLGRCWSWWIFFSSFSFFVLIPSASSADLFTAISHGSLCSYFNKASFSSLFLFLVQAVQALRRP